MLSSFKKVNKGVPQGSILGPVLFLIYINDLPKSLNYSEPFLYADDTTLLANDTSLHNLTEKLASDLANGVNVTVFKLTLLKQLSWSSLPAIKALLSTRSY